MSLHENTQLIAEAAWGVYRAMLSCNRSVMFPAYDAELPECREMDSLMPDVLKVISEQPGRVDDVDAFAAYVYSMACPLENGTPDPEAESAFCELDDMDKMFYEAVATAAFCAYTACTVVDAECVNHTALRALLSGDRVAYLAALDDMAQALIQAPGVTLTIAGIADQINRSLHGALPDKPAPPLASLGEEKQAEIYMAAQKALYPGQGAQA